MSKNIILAFLLCVITTAGWAQENNRRPFSPEQFKEDMERFITKKAELTPQESAKFFPLFNELREKQRALNEEMKSVWGKAMNGNLSDDDYLNFLVKSDDAKVQSANLQRTYTKKLCKIMSPKKVWKAFGAENHFHRQMLKKAVRPPRHKD